MITLFIDTTGSLVSISIVKDMQYLSKIEKDIPNMHSIYVTKFIKDALDDAKIDANDINNIMVVNGPGSFTGVRIGVTIAKTYGYLIKKEIIPVSSLKCLAISSNYDNIVMSIIPANKSSYYVGIYDKDYNCLIDEGCLRKEDIISLCQKYQPYIISNNQSILGEYKINKQKLDMLKIVNYYLDKEKVNPHKLVPNYLKLPQALEDKHG